MATDRDETSPALRRPRSNDDAPATAKLKKGAGTFKSPSGQTVTIGQSWVEDFGITDWNSLQRAIRQGVGGAQGINAKIDGTDMLLTNNPNNPGFRSAGQVAIGGGLTGVPTAGFAEDHKKTIGIGSDNFNLGLGAVGAAFGANALLGGLGGLGGAAGAADLATGAATAGAGGAAPLAGGIGAGGALWNVPAGETGAFDMMGSAGTGLPAGTAGANTATSFTVGGGLNTAQTAALAQAGFSPAAISALQAAAGAGGAPTGLLGGNNGTTFGIPNNILGGLLTAGGGLAAADAQGDAYERVADKYLALGAPGRAQYDALTNPNFNLASLPGLQSALDTAAQTSARALSTKYGNPADSPTAQAEMNKYLMGSIALPQYNTAISQALQRGGMGVNIAGTGDLSGAQSAGSGWEAIGSGANQIFNPQPTLSDLFKQYGMGGNQNYSINIGGLNWK